MELGFLFGFISIVLNLHGIIRIGTYIVKKLPIHKYFQKFEQIKVLFNFSLIIFLEDKDKSILLFMCSIFISISILLAIIVIQKSQKIPNIITKKSETRKRKHPIILGQEIWKKWNVGTINLSIEDLQRNILIYGQTGSGKSTLLKNVIKQINHHFPDIPFLIFEYKGEFENMQNLENLENLEIIKPGINFFIDIFNPEMIAEENYAEFLFDSFKSCQILNFGNEFSSQMEAILIEAFQKNIREKGDWETLFRNLDEIRIKNNHIIPNLDQTIISIKNRLRKYRSGILKSLFIKGENQKISELLEKKCIVELGSILKIGGSKEDLILVANLILKWIWTKNVNNTATENLKHITIFEDVSYLASKKIITQSNLSTYLEDIALLLRGKGECLISLTTTLNISENIIFNSGTKIFFKFNQKNEDVLYYLGIQSNNSNIRTNELKTGYFLVKKDSEADFSLGYSIPQRSVRKKEKLQVMNKENVKIQKKSCISDLVSDLEEGIFLNNRDKLSKDFKILIDELNNYSNNDIELRTAISKIDFTSQTIDDYLFILNLIRKRSFYREIEGDKINQKEKKKTEFDTQNDYTIVLTIFDNIIGPEIYYNIGKIKPNDEKFLKSQMLMENNVIEIKNENQNYIINNFEIPSKLARGGMELAQLAFISNKSFLNKDLKLIKEISTKILDIEDCYLGFYLKKNLKNIEKSKILEISLKIKNILKHCRKNDNVKKIYEERDIEDNLEILKAWAKEIVIWEQNH